MDGVRVWNLIKVEIELCCLLMTTTRGGARRDDA